MGSVSRIITRISRAHSLFTGVKESVYRLNPLTLQAVFIPCGSLLCNPLGYWKEIFEKRNELQSHTGQYDV